MQEGLMMKDKTCSSHKEQYDSIINEEPYTCVKCGRRDIGFFDLVNFEIKDNKVKHDSVYCFECQLDKLKSSK